MKNRHCGDIAFSQQSDVCWVFQIWRAGLGSLNRSSNICSKCVVGFSFESFCLFAAPLPAVDDHIFLGLKPFASAY